MEKKSLFEDLVSFDEPVNLEEPTEGKDPEIQEPNEEPVDESESTNVEEDDRVKVLYYIMVDSNIIEADEEFKPTVENFEELVSVLPEHFLAQAVSKLPDFVQDIIQLGFENPSLSVDDISKFFETYHVAQERLVEPTTDDEAYDFLKPVLLQTKLFPTEAKAEKYLDDLMEEGMLLDKAKEVYQERLEELDKLKQEELAQVSAMRKQAEEQQRAFYETLFDTVEDLDWESSRKKTVLDNLHPDEVQRKNQLIAQSPKALVQLADIYSYFNEDKGEFDFSDFGIRKVSKKLREEKDSIERDKVSSHLSKLKTNPKDPGGSFWASFKQTN